MVAIIGIIAAIAVPGLLRARMSGNEASAIGSLRAINSGQASLLRRAALRAGMPLTSTDLVKPPSGSSAGLHQPRPEHEWRDQERLQRDHRWRTPRPA